MREWIEDYHPKPPSQDERYHGRGESLIGDKVDNWMYLVLWCGNVTDFRFQAVWGFVFECEWLWFCLRVRTCMYVWMYIYHIDTFVCDMRLYSFVHIVKKYRVIDKINYTASLAMNSKHSPYKVCPRCTRNGLRPWKKLQKTQPRSSQWQQEQATTTAQAMTSPTLPTFLQRTCMNTRKMQEFCSTGKSISIGVSLFLYMLYSFIFIACITLSSSIYCKGKIRIFESLSVSFYFLS